MDEFEINIKDRNRRRRLHATMHKNSVTGSDMEHHRTYTPAYERVADTVSEAIYSVQFLYLRIAQFVCIYNKFVK